MQQLTRRFTMLSYDDNALVWKDRPLVQALFKTLEAQIDVDWMSTSRQGMYAFTVSGEMLGQEVLRKNYDDAMTRAEPVKALLGGALEAYGRLADATRRKASVKAAALIAEKDGVTPHDKHRAEAALALRVTGRDLPRDGTFAPHLWSANGRWEPRSAFNIDHVWFRTGEARALLPAELAPGASATVPAELVARLARFHFLNNIRCHTAVPHRAEDVTTASVECRVVSIEGGIATVTWDGEVAASHGARTEWERDWHGTDPIGFEGRLSGEGRWDIERREFVALRLLALGQRFGGEGTRDGEPRTPIGFAMAIVGDDPRDMAAPSAIQNGNAREYWGTGEAENR